MLGNSFDLVTLIFGFCLGFGSFYLLNNYIYKNYCANISLFWTIFYKSYCSFCYNFAEIKLFKSLEASFISTVTNAKGVGCTS